MIEALLKDILDKGFEDVREICYKSQEIFREIGELTSNLVGEVANFFSKLGIMTLFENVLVLGEEYPTLSEAATILAKTYLFILLAKNAEMATTKTFEQKTGYKPLLLKELPVFGIDDVADIFGGFYELLFATIELLESEGIHFDLEFSLKKKTTGWQLYWIYRRFPRINFEKLKKGCEQIAELVVDLTYFSFATIIDQWMYLVRNFPPNIFSLIMSKLVFGAEKMKEFLRQVIKVYYKFDFEIETKTYGLRKIEKYLYAESSSFETEVTRIVNTIAKNYPIILTAKPLWRNIKFFGNPIGFMVDYMPVWRSVGGVETAARYTLGKVPVFLCCWFMKPILTEEFEKYARKKINKIIEILS